MQVLDPNPFPGLTVSPLHGVVPVGGVAELKVDLAPNAVMKFDTRVQIAIRSWKTLELRMGGTVEPPSVDISVVSFNQISGYMRQIPDHRKCSETRLQIENEVLIEFQFHFSIVSSRNLQHLSVESIC